MSIIAPSLISIMRFMPLVVSKSSKIYFSALMRFFLGMLLRSKMALPSACFLAFRNRFFMVSWLSLSGPFISQVVPSIKMSGFWECGIEDGRISSTSNPNSASKSTVRYSWFSKRTSLWMMRPIFDLGGLCNSVIFTNLIIPWCKKYTNVFRYCAFPYKDI